MYCNAGAGIGCCPKYRLDVCGICLVHSTLSVPLRYSGRSESFELQFQTRPETRHHIPKHLNLPNEFICMVISGHGFKTIPNQRQKFLLYSTCFNKPEDGLNWSNHAALLRVFVLDCIVLINFLALVRTEN